ncbi:MAG: hypothetical protein HOI23_23400 [Deltaproteobacteria bacterium]|jgi:hypothetical protein|nr:hypothetical protein [Deltaproteobacteria bacterium]MBT6431698.1 hypothetical protein [Deltaproteobacteria bacterium]MBT6491453.1 hypothetical protein [Deltaproteobacteria bacterium]
MFYKAKLASVLTVTLLALYGCGDETSPADQDPTDGQDSTNTEETFVSLCASTPDIDDYSPDLVRTGDQFKLTLVSAAPAPWDVGDNIWTLKVEDLQGNAVEDALIRVTPYMPDHGHGVSPPYYAGVTQGSGGLYDIETFNLIMPGFWEMTVEVSASGTSGEAIAFRICVEG